MKLSLLSENSGLTLYKGVSEYGGLMQWPTHEVGTQDKIIPGFLSSWDIARVYSEPTLTGEHDSNTMIAEFNIKKASVEDRTKEFTKWCDTDNNNKYHDISMSFPIEWQDDKSIWMVRESGSGHSDANCHNGASFVYCGILVPYTVVAFYHNQAEWDADE